MGYQEYAKQLRRNLRLALAESSTRERTSPMRRSHIGLNGVHYQAGYASRDLVLRGDKHAVVWTIHVYRLYNQRRRWKKLAQGATLLRALRKAELLEAKIPG